jgi:hypothetical protein
MIKIMHDEIVYRSSSCEGVPIEEILHENYILRENQASIAELLGVENSYRNIWEGLLKVIN